MSITPNAIQGLDELKRKLRELAPKAERKVLRAAWRQAANTIRDAARANAAETEKTGKLKKGIKTSSARGKRGTIRFKVRAEARKISKKYPDPGYPYGLAVEAGHGAPNTRKRQFKSTPAGQEFGGSRTPAKPFMRPAWNESKEKVLQRFGDEAGRGIEKVAAEKT